MKSLPYHGGTGRLAGRLLPLCLAWAVSAFGAESPSAESRLDASLQLLVRAQREAQSAAAGAKDAREPRPPQRARGLFDRLHGARRADHTTQSTGVEPRLSLLVRFRDDCSSLEAVGFRLQAQVGRVCTGTLAADRLMDLASADGVQFVRSSQMLRALGSPKSPSAGGDPVSDTAARPSSSESAPRAAAPNVLSGAGVLVAFIDTGVDVHHQDFRKPGGATRIKYLLDFSDPGDSDGDGDLDGTGPFGGTLYTEAQINEALTGGSAFREKDTTGHGTHGLSVAAGDDPTSPGMAPAADLIVVKAARDDATLGFVSTDVINALSFVDQKATELGLPYVVNLSLGTIVASHDGRSLEEQAIDSLVGPGRAGKVAVLAAGNSSENHSATRFHHLAGTTYVGILGTHTLKVPSYTPNLGQGNDRVFLDVWYKGRDKLALSVTPPGGTPVSATFGSYVDVATPQGNVFIANLGGPSLENGDVEALILIDDWTASAPAVGDWTIGFQGEEIGDSGEYHAWLADESVVGSVSPYLSANADNHSLVGKPGSSVNGITVGSYARHDAANRFRTSWTDVNGIARTDTTAILGDISDFSSTGKTRDGRVKPDVTAPGERVLGAVSQDAVPGVAPASIYRYHSFPEPDALLTDATPEHGFGLLQGTSFSAPVVAGLAARILSTNPALDAIQVRNILVNSASSDGFTGAVPNEVWGYGKVDQAVGGGTLPADLRITTDALPDCVLGEAYDRVLTASGGKLPYAWSPASGSLPTGLTLDATGHISGGCSAGGNFDFTAQVSDGSAPAQTVSKALRIVVTATPSLEITTLVLPAGVVGQAYDQPLEATGGVPPVSWTLSGGSPPSGLSLSAAGRLTGTPTTLGKFNFTVRATDAAAADVNRSIRMRITVDRVGLWNEVGRADTVVSAIAIDPTNTAHLFAATRDPFYFDTAQNAVAESLDGGATWHVTSVNNDFGSFPPPSVPTPPDGLWVDSSGRAWAARANGTDNLEHLFLYQAGLGSWIDRHACGGFSAALSFDVAGRAFLMCGRELAVKSSSDQGATWAALGTVCGPFYVNDAPALAVHPASPQFMYLTRGYQTTTTTCRSQDGGATWNEVAGTALAQYGLRVSAADPLDVVRAVDYGTGTGVTLERSTDGGLTWTSRKVPFETDAVSSVVFERSASAPATLLVGATIWQPSSRLYQLFRSTDLGQTWAELRVGGVSALAFGSLAIDPTDAARFYVGTDAGIFFTGDEGSTWKALNAGLVRRGQVGLAISRTRPEEMLLAANGTEFFLSRTGGARWMGVAGGVGRPAISVADPRLYVGGAYTPGGTGGAWSSDGGLTWSGLVDRRSANILEPDPFNPNTLLYAWGPRPGVSVTPMPPAGVFRSTDRAQSWVQVSAMDDAWDVSYAVDVPGRVFLAAASDPPTPTSGVHRSTDGGVTWSPFGLAGIPVRMARPAPSDSSYIYAATAPGTSPSIYFFDPALGSWQVPATPPDRAILSLTVDWSDSSTAYAGGDHPGTPGAWGGLFKTTDGGRHWARLPGVLDSFDVVSVVTHPTVSGTVYVATAEGGAYRSADAGNSWTLLDKYSAVPDIVNAAYDRARLWLVTQGYGVMDSVDGGKTFRPQNSGLTSYGVNALVFDPQYPLFIPGRMYAATDGGLFRDEPGTCTGSGGPCWTPVGTIPSRITDVAIDYDSDTLVRRIWATVPGQGVAYSADGGTSFTIYSTGLASLDLTSLELEVVGAVRRIWATTRGGDGVAYSDDLGQTWHSAAGTGLTNRNVNDFIYESSAVRRIWATVRRIWATTDGGVFYSDDDGTSWTELSLGLPSGAPVTSVSIDPNTNEVMVSLFSDREGGVYRGANLSGVWTAFNDGLEELKVKKLTNDGGRVVAAATKATSFYAATSGDGAYQTEVRSSAVVVSPLSITTASLAAGRVRTAYSQALSASGGVAPYSWSLPEGFLPPGLTLNVTTGVISGDPGRSGTFSFSVQVKDKDARLERKALSIVVADPFGPTLTSFAPSSGKVGTIVTLSGTLFSDVLSVSFAGVSASFTVVSPTQITASVPAGAETGKVSVTTAVGKAQSALSFTVVGQAVSFYTVPPCRLVDTRNPNGPLGGPALVAGADRSFSLGGVCGIPTTARSVSVNVTVTQGTTAGNLLLFPSGTEAPLASTINFTAGLTRANNAVVMLGTAASLAVRSRQAAGSVHFILDVNGYFE